MDDAPPPHDGIPSKPEDFALSRFLRAAFNERANPDDYSHQMDVIMGQLGMVQDPLMLKEMLFIALQQLQKIVPQSMKDELTGLANRSAYNHVLERLTGGNAPQEGRFSLLVIDIDHFKKFNDQFGHDNGDHVLKMTAGRITRSVRYTDLVARYGGEEIVVVMPGAALENAERVAEKIRADIASGNLSARTGDKALPTVTVSIGVAERQEGESADDVFKRADNALYAAKNNGRNRVETDRTVSPTIQPDIPKPRGGGTSGI